MLAEVVGSCVSWSAVLEPEAFWSFLFHLIDFYLCDRPEEFFGREFNLRINWFLCIFGRVFELRMFFCCVLDLKNCLLVSKKIE